MPNEVNPLGFIGKSRVPPPDNSALQKLLASGAIAKLNNQAAGERTAATNDSREFSSGLPLGIDTRGPNVGSDLATLRRGLEAIRGGKAADSFRSAGISLNDQSTPFTPGEFPNQPVRGGFDLKGVAQAKAGVEAERQTSGSTSLEGLQMPSGSPVGIQKVKKETGTKNTDTQKNTPAAQRESKIPLDKAKAQRMILFFQKKYPGKAITGPSTSPSGRVQISIDGKDFYVD